MPAFIAAGARIEDSLIAAGATVHGTVQRSVIGPGTVVEEGAVVADSVLLHNVRVGPDARLVRVIADDSVVVGRNSMIGDDGGITVLGAGNQVPAERLVAAGTELEPGSGTSK